MWGRQILAGTEGAGMKGIFLTISAIVVLLYTDAFAVDAPHATATGCADCHTLHLSPGPSLTNNASNANLCQSCHVDSGVAMNRPLSDVMQAVPRVSGISHRWDRSMAAGVAPLNLAVGDANNIYGLRTVGELANAALVTRLQGNNNVVTCSVCHDQHSQARAPWDPSAPGSGAGRHFQRINNDLNQMCEDCHFYRVQTHASVEGPTAGNTIFSHPVTQALNDNAKGYDRAAPLDVNGAAQSGVRFATGGTGDSNGSNNLVFDGGSPNKVRCLTCHRIHYTDSNSLSTDVP